MLWPSHSLESNKNLMPIGRLWSDTLHHHHHHHHNTIMLKENFLEERGSSLKHCGIWMLFWWLMVTQHLYFFPLLCHLSVYYCFLSFVSSTGDYVMLCAVSLQSQQVAFPQAHGPGAVPDCSFMTRQHQIFDLQLAILEE